MNRAKPGTTRCGVHTRRPIAEPEKAARRPRLRVTRSASLSFVWEGAGPITTYGAGNVQWDHLRVVVDLDDPQVPEYVTHGVGRRLKKDGSRSESVVKADFLSVGRVPGFAEEIAETLKEEFS
jgi:hypothetical protein